MTIKNNYFNNQRFIQSINRRLYTIENKLRIALSHRHKPIRIALEKNNDFVRCQIQDEIEEEHKEKPTYACLRIDRIAIFANKIPKNVAGIILFGTKDRLIPRIVAKIYNCIKDNDVTNYDIKLQTLNFGEGMGDSGYILDKKLWSDCTVQHVFHKPEPKKDLIIKTNVTYTDRLGDHQFELSIKDSRENSFPYFVIGFGSMLILCLIFKLISYCNKKNRLEDVSINEDQVDLEPVGIQIDTKNIDINNIDPEIAIPVIPPNNQGLNKYVIRECEEVKPNTTKF